MPPFQATFRSDDWPNDQLIANNSGLLYTEPAVLVSGQNLKRGALVGKITTGGKLSLSLAASSDGSQAPYGVLVDDCDASAGDKPCLVYVRGDFQDRGLTLGTGHTVASVEAVLRDKGIFIFKTQGGL